MVIKDLKELNKKKIKELEIKINEGTIDLKNELIIQKKLNLYYKMTNQFFLNTNGKHPKDIK